MIFSSPPKGGARWVGGTGGSNPSRSTGESANRRSLNGGATVGGRRCGCGGSLEKRCSLTGGPTVRNPPSPARCLTGNAIPGFSLPMSDCRVALTRGSLPTQRVKRARPTGAAHDRIHATPPSSTVHAMSVSSYGQGVHLHSPWATKIRATL